MFIYLSNLNMGGGGGSVDAPETRAALYDVEGWQPADEYEASVGQVVNLTDDAAVVADDPEARIALFDEQPDLVTDEQYVNDQYTEPIGGVETYITPEPDPLLEEEYDAAAIADSPEDSLEGIFPPAADEDHGFEHTDGETPFLVEDAAAPADDPETRPALDGVYDIAAEDAEGETPFLVEDAAAPADDPETRPALDGVYDIAAEDAEGETAQLFEDSLEGIDAVGSDDHGFDDVDGEIPQFVEDSIEGIVAIYDEPYDDDNLYDPSFVSEQIDELEIDDSLEGIVAIYDEPYELHLDAEGETPQFADDSLEGIVALYDEWEPEVEWGAWSTDFDAEAEPVRRPRRPSIRPIREGYGTTPGVESRGEVGTPIPRGAVRGGVPGGAFVESVLSTGEVGVAGGASGARAVAGNLRQVRGNVGAPMGYGAGCATAMGGEATGEHGVAVGAAGGCAQVCGYEAPGEVGAPSGGGILNPSDAEIVALIVALRKRRKKS